jgi:ATP-dependent DNA helicase DinG
MKEPKIHFPLKHEPRKQQIEMLKFTADSINHSKKFILLNAPTGVGKSYYVAMLANWYMNNIEEDVKFDIITNSKVLQEQYVKDFNFICNLKGRANYHCDPFDTDCEKGMELCSALKKQCDSCPYINQRNAWLMSEIGLSNFHLFNTFAMYNPTMIDKKDKPARVLVIDEAHDFEAVFSDFITVKLSGKTLKRYGFSSKEIQDIDKRIAKLKTLESCVYYLKLFFIDEINEKYNNFEKEIKIGTSMKRSTEITRYMTHIVGQKERFKMFINDYEDKMEEGGIDPKENWVMDIETNSKNTFGSGVEITISPVWVHKYLPQYIWNKFDHIIFMSGTILDKKMFSFINGLTPKITSYMDMASPFKIKHRPVYYLKCGKMTYNEKENTFKNQEKYIRKIIDKYKKDKGIIHTTTYEFSKWIEDAIFNDRFLFHDSTNREEKLDEHKDNIKPTIIISPSMHTGVDLKDDLSRFQIMLKIPYPNISSNKIKQRQKTKPEWYNWKTIVDFIQALGRSVRSEEDYADTYVLDSSLSSLLKYNGHLIPRYITNAIKEIKIK